jgi:hypothetical protein
MSLHDKQRYSLVTLKGQGAPDAISLTPGQEVAQIEAELRTLGLRRGHKCPFCRLPVPETGRWNSKDCGLMYRGLCPNAKPRVNALGRRLRHLREAAEAEGVAEAVAEGLVAAYQGAPAPEVAEEIVWSAPAEAHDAPAARKERCACLIDGQRCRKLVLEADDWVVSLGDWDPERYCSQDCAQAERARAEKVLESAPEPAPSTKAKPLQRSHDGGLAGMIAACAKPPDEEKEETSSEVDEDEDESSADAASSVDDAPPAPHPGRVAGVVRKVVGNHGYIRLEGVKRQKDAPDGRGNEAHFEQKHVRAEERARRGDLRVGDRVHFRLVKAPESKDVRYAKVKAVDIAPLSGMPTPAPRPAADAPSGDALVDALHAWIVGQGKTRVDGGALTKFWAAHPSVPRAPKGQTAAHIMKHGGSLLRYENFEQGERGGRTKSSSARAPRRRQGRRRRPARGRSAPSRGGRARGAAGTASSSARRARRTSSSTSPASGRAYSR